VGQPGPHAAHRRWHPARASLVFGTRSSWPSEREEGWGGPSSELLVREDAPWLSSWRARFRRPCRVRDTSSPCARSRRRSSRCGRTQRSFTLAIDVARPGRRAYWAPSWVSHGGSPRVGDRHHAAPATPGKRLAAHPHAHHEDRHLGRDSHLRLARRRSGHRTLGAERLGPRRDHTEPTMRIAPRLGIALGFLGFVSTVDSVGPFAKGAAAKRRSTSMPR